LIGNTQLVQRALSRLNSHNILSLPVIDDQTKNIIGLIDVFDLIAVLETEFEKVEDGGEGAQGEGGEGVGGVGVGGAGAASSTQTATPATSTNGNQYTAAGGTPPPLATRRGLRWDALVKPVSEVLTKAAHRKVYLVTVSASLKDAIIELAKGELQRVMIVDREFPQHSVIEMTDPEPNVIAILSQMDVLRFLAENCAWMDREEVFHKTIEELGLGKRTPITISESTSAAEAFRLIHKQQVGGVALVDDSGRLVSNLSASDIKNISLQTLRLLNRPVSEFLTRNRRRAWWSLPICFSPHDTLKHVIMQFVATKTHRMYLIDENMKPVGELNLTDCMHQLLNIQMA